VGTPGNLTPLQQVRQHLLGLKRQSLANSRPAIPLDRLDVPPPDSRPFVLVSAPYPNFPAPGAAAVVLLTYNVPVGFNAVINLMAIFQLGGGLINGSGNAIWRVLLNDTGWKGLNNMLSQLGTDSQPLPSYIHLVENDTFKVTVEVPAGQPLLNAVIGARIHGYEYAIGKS
jgi:hypothetical protein